MRRARPRNRREPVVALINIVFLILIFFMVAGTLTRADRSGVAFIQTAGLDCCIEPDALAVSEEGRIFNAEGAPIDIAEYVSGRGEGRPAIRLLPDRNLPAARLLDIIDAFKRAGAGRIVVVTEAVSS